MVAESYPPPDYSRWLHLAGKSIFKNTEAVLHAWFNQPELPHLTVLVHGLPLKRLQDKHPEWFEAPPPPNLFLLTEPLSSSAVSPRKANQRLCQPGTLSLDGRVRRWQRYSRAVVSTSAPPLERASDTTSTKRVPPRPSS